MPQNKKMEEYYKSVSTSPFTTFTRSTPLKLFCVWLSLVPQLILLFASKSYGSLLIILCAVLGTLCGEWANKFEKSKIRFSIAYSLLVGTFIGFFLPPTFPPVSVFLTSFIFVAIIKNIFGPFGVSWINPVLVCVAAMWFTGRMNFGGFQILGGDLLLKNPSLNLTDAALLTNGADEKITLFLNDFAFGFFNVSIPNGYVSLFWDSHALIPAFRFSFLTLLSSMVLIAFELQSPTVPFSMLLTYGLLVRFLSPVFTGAVALSGDVLLAFLSGGILFAVFYVLPWPGTIPYTVWGRVAYGIFGGLVAFVFCGTGTSPVGAVMTLLFMNIGSPAIQLFENQLLRKRLSAVITQKLGGPSK